MTEIRQFRYCLLRHIEVKLNPIKKKGNQMAASKKESSLRHVIVNKPIGDLVPYARNARTHSEEQVAQIAHSIMEFGWTNPVLVDQENSIIAGHGRVLAAEKLQLITVPCIVLAGLSEAQKRAYVIADNKLAENAEWNAELLGVELMDLSGLGFDMSLIGFTQEELNALLPPPPGGASPAPTGANEQNPVIQFNIVFENYEQQDVWFKFIRYVKSTHVEYDTLGGALQRFIEVNGYGAS